LGPPNQDTFSRTFFEIFKKEKHYLMKDKKITCKDCGTSFVFTVEEQEFFAQKGFTNEPTRCKDCRASRKNSDRRQSHDMHPAICAACGKSTQVPFKPRSDKPIYCNDCFKK